MDWFPFFLLLFHFSFKVLSENLEESIASQEQETQSHLRIPPLKTIDILDDEFPDDDGLLNKLFYLSQQSKIILILFFFFFVRFFFSLNDCLSFLFWIHCFGIFIFFLVCYILWRFNVHVYIFAVWLWCCLNREMLHSMRDSFRFW